MNRTPPPTAVDADLWHRDWFDQDYLLLYSHRDHREADLFLDTLSRDHGFHPLDDTGAPVRVLDLGCGNGRHSLELARRGFRSVGLDWSADLLAVAHAADPEGRFLRGDMDHPPLKPVFHWVLNLFTSFGYHREDGRNRRRLERMAALVRPGGHLVIDYLNPAQVEAGLVEYGERRVGPLGVREWRRIDREHNRVVKDLELDHGEGRVRRVREAVKLYGHRWFTGILEPLGFRRLAHLGHYDGRPYTESADEPCPRSILVLALGPEGAPR